MKRLFYVLSFALLLTFLPAQLDAASLTPANAVPGELIVKFKPSISLNQHGQAFGAQVASLNASLRSIGAETATSLGDASQTYQITVRHDRNIHALAQQLAAHPAVEYAEPNYIRTLMRTTNDPIASQQWALRQIQAFEAWDITTGGEIVIALLDTGVSSSHPDLKGKVLPGYDFANRDSDASDDEGHGTYTAGVAAAHANNGEGIAGVCWNCKILPVKVLNRRGQGADANIAAGIRWAVDQGARIISMSLGGPEDSQVLRDAVTYARERNALLIAASGNGQADGNRPNYPAAYPGVLAVSATTPSDQVTGFSTTGDFVDIAAPGVGVWSTIWTPSQGDTYGPSNGTSAACPYVAGAAALILTLRPDLSADQIADILLASTDDILTPGKDDQSGYGRLNLLRAVQMAADPNVLSSSRIQGRVIGAGAGVTVALNTGQQTQTDASGFYSFGSLPAGLYIVSISGQGISAAPQEVWVSGTALSVATVDFHIGNAIVGGGAANQYFQPVPPPTDGARYFPETGHTLRGAFLSYWQANGGLPIFGYPISEAFVERGEDGNEYVVQYFERHRLEQHPENAPPYNILLSRVGINMLEMNGRDWFTFPKGQPQSGCQYFEATGHSLCEPFLSYWRSHGLEFDGRAGKSEAESLALFGQPLSEPQIEISSNGMPYVTQWFERARFEDHGPDGVLLGLLGNEFAALRGLR
jgi:thermitase